MTTGLIELAEHAPQRVAQVHGHVENSEFDDFLTRALEEVRALLADQRLSPTGPPFARYRPTGVGLEIDAGFDSHENHRLARGELKIRSWIKARVGLGRPGPKGPPGASGDKPPTSRYRRLMAKKLKGSQKGKLYGQRSQAETVNSMMKRNLGDHLRARMPEGRRKEQMLRVLTHNLSIFLARTDED